MKIFSFLCPTNTTSANISNEEVIGKSRSREGVDSNIHRLSKTDTVESIIRRPNFLHNRKLPGKRVKTRKLPGNRVKSAEKSVTFNVDDHSKPSSERRGAVAITVDDMDILLTGNRNTKEMLTAHSSILKRLPSALSLNNLTMSRIHQSSHDFRKFLWRDRGMEWLSSFQHLDPRHQIRKFFNDVAREGAYMIEEADRTIKEEAVASPVLRAFSRAAAFSVWRPTSNDAIQKMMTGQATGKGLNVKGKSAKKGILSGFVPFLQIHEERHKIKVRWPPKDGLIRIYYLSEAARDRAALELASVSDEMVAIVSEAKETISNKSCSVETAIENLKFDVVDSNVRRLDDYSPSRFGIIVAERIFFNAYISRQDVSRSSDYDTGRPSEPAFQDMNFECIRKYKGNGPRAVVLQIETVDTALSPQSLVVAYEENGSVTPVVSDFDCFLVGTRNVYYTSSSSKYQVELLRWLLTQIDTILDSPATSKSWTSRWLDVLKESAEKGFYPEIPEFGFGDPKSYAIMKEVVRRLGDNGAVRHGAECFNYSFPQELDNRFLVISDHLEGNVPWKYVDVQELQSILYNRIDAGFTFPLNPKWIVANHGWKAVYDKMMSSNSECVKKSLAVWYPEGSGIRELIEDICRRFPDGFQRLDVENDNQDEKAEGTEAMDLAEQQLKRYLILQRAKFKLRCALCLMNVGK